MIVEKHVYTSHRIELAPDERFDVVKHKLTLRVETIVVSVNGTISGQGHYLKKDGSVGERAASTFLTSMWSLGKLSERLTQVVAAVRDAGGHDITRTEM